ncbi:hypothetical protein PAESOLCIP111_03539 [Paenibacillus solanacearum]|uniref:Polysaccharide pyruvyl transferase domain-containing protein n=1 Tax=Paenibacillus solanacearum TaxID=2048548 RepID=A0A916K6F0_9BACL|nr:polysaccharide pyruvyl transferase CsaB [Paenibacillus solanacearum]CAG7634176.1 hypothetical protein PAESOLCIP111_03539 [Paenibacillus solanacearum]
MGTPAKRIVISGYYGFNNSGDEAVLQSILLALQEQGERQGVLFVPVVLSVTPGETSRTYGVESVHRMKPGEVWAALRGADGLISGGGSLLQDETGWKTIPYYLAVIRLAQWLNKPVFIYSQGIGPVNRPMFHGWVRSAFQRCTYITVRDEESKALLTRTGLSADRVQVVPDPVMGMPLRSRPPQNREDGSNCIIGVSVRFWRTDRAELHAIAQALRTILDETEAHVRFLPFHLPSDQEASLYVLGQIGGNYEHRISLADGIVHPQDMLAEVAECRLLIGMRLHSLIYAASQFVPMVGVSYDPKIDQFLNRLDMKAATSTQSASAADIAEHSLALLANGKAWKEDKHPAIERLKNEAQRPAALIASFYAKGRD